MTPLERAKAFVQSRAARTALKILPFALAAVVSTQAVAANITSASASFSTNDQGCSGGTCITFVPGQINNNQVSTLPAVATFSGSTATGTGDAPMELFGGKNGSATASFVMNGTGDGGPFTGLNVSWNFLVTCDAACSFNIKNPPPPGSTLFQDDFTYDVNLLVNGTDLYSWSGNPTDFTSSVDPTPVTGSFAFNGLNSNLNSWIAEVDVSWLGNTGETADWNMNHLTVNFTSPVSTTPEPASMMLAFAGLPFVLRTIRKKR